MNDLPSPVQEILSQEFMHVKLAEFEKAFSSLSTSYRSGKKKSHSFIRNEKEHLLYLATRLPATYAAVCEVFYAFQKVVGVVEEGSILDIGTGPGTLLVAAWKMGISFSKATLIESDAAWRVWAEKIIRSLHPHLPLEWHFEDIGKLLLKKLPAHDLVTLSYSLNELPHESRTKILEGCWNLTQKFLFLIEPGTPEGFSRIREARDFLLHKGAHILAPCTHAMECPMSKNDWCHFSARFARTSLHRRIKGATLGHEDEKYSYVIVSRQPHSLSDGRIVHTPQKNKGHIGLPLCRDGKIEVKIFSKKQGDLYKQACRSNWGDSWP